MLASSTSTCPNFAHLGVDPMTPKGSLNSLDISTPSSTSLPTLSWQSHCLSWQALAYSMPRHRLLCILLRFGQSRSLSFLPVLKENFCEMELSKTSGRWASGIRSDSTFREILLKYLWIRICGRTFQIRLNELIILQVRSHSFMKQTIMASSVTSF